jgi:predicted dehydrogenase
VTALIRIGLAGVAHYHAAFWATAFAADRRCELVGAWDERPERGRAFAEAHDVEYIDSLDQLLDDCDAVGITSETSRHADYVEAAARCGVHVLLEKPMARSLAEARRIATAVRNTGTVFMQNLPKRYDPASEQLLNLVTDGVLGELSLVRVRHGNHGFLGPDAQTQAGWMADPELAGGGALIDEGVHATDLVYWLLGMPAGVVAASSSRTSGLPVEDTMVAVFDYVDGTIAEVTAGNVFVGAAGSVEVYGTEAAAVLTGVDLASRDLASAPYLQLVRRTTNPPQWETVPTQPRFTEGKQAFHGQGPVRFLDLLSGDAEPVVPVDDAWCSLAMVQAAYRSAEIGRRVAVAQTLDENG